MSLRKHSVLDVGLIAGVACVAGVGPCAMGSVGPRMVLYPGFDVTTHSTVRSEVAEAIEAMRAEWTPSRMLEMRSMGADIGEFRRDAELPERTIGSWGSVSAGSGENGYRGGYESGFDYLAVGEYLVVGDGLLSPAENMRFLVGRNTSLNDGNIAGSGGGLPGGQDSVSSLTQREGEYNFYEMAVEWQAASAGAVDFTLISGVTAIEANVSKQVGSGATSGLYDVTHRVVAVPTIGSAVRWNISPDWSVSGQATTQSIDLGSSLIGFNAQSNWKISDRIGFSAGYQILKSEFDLGAVNADLDQEGLFARLQIRF